MTSYKCPHIDCGFQAESLEHVKRHIHNAHTYTLNPQRDSYIPKIAEQQLLPPMSKYAIMYAPITEEIQIGRLNKAGKSVT